MVTGPGSCCKTHKNAFRGGDLDGDGAPEEFPGATVKSFGYF